MELIKDLASTKGQIEKEIQTHGFGVEHNYWNLFYFQGKSTDSYFFTTKKGSAFCLHYNNMWELIPGILAKEEDRYEVLQDFLEYLFTNKTANKITLILPKEYKEKLKEENKYNISKTHTTFFLPEYKISEWDPELKGGHNKKLRNLYNSFITEHNTEFIPTKEISKENLLQLFRKWKNKRSSSAVWQPHFYESIINNKFEGIENAYSLCIDGKPHTICGGWKVPNSNDYYSLLGLLSYESKGLGEVATIMEFNMLKKQGFDVVHTGQSDKSLLDFKKKFHPSKIEEEILFSVTKHS